MWTAWSVFTRYCHIPRYLNLPSLIITLFAVTYNKELFSGIEISRGTLGDSGIVDKSVLISDNGMMDDNGGSGVMGDNEAVGPLVSESDIL